MSGKSTHAHAPAPPCQAERQGPHKPAGPDVAGCLSSTPHGGCPRKAHIIPQLLLLRNSSCSCCRSFTKRESGSPSLMAPRGNAASPYLTNGADRTSSHVRLDHLRGCHPESGQSYTWGEVDKLWGQASWSLDPGSAIFLKIPHLQMGILMPTSLGY